MRTGSLKRAFCRELLTAPPYIQEIQHGRALQGNMRTPKSVAALEDLGRVRLSKSFFMRDFLYSEIANFYGLSNIPDNPDLAIANGKRLCEELLEPLNATFGRIAVRSAYRSPTINAYGNEEGPQLRLEWSNFAGHIWDVPDKRRRGSDGMCRSPWFADRYEAGADWRAMAYWVHNHLPYSELQFFPKLCAFSIGWHDQPRRAVYSFIKPAIELPHGSPPAGVREVVCRLPQAR
jgi:hypothetical protein